MTQKTEDKRLKPTCRSDGMMMTRGPALLPEENREDYETLRARIAAAVAPADAIEELWAEDVAELTFEIKRLREIRVRIVAIARADAVRALIQPAADFKGIALAKSWRQGNEEGANDILAKMNLTPADVTAKAFELRLAEVETVDGMIGRAAARRDVALREIERRREALAARLRAAAAIEEADYEEIEHPAALAQVRDGRARR